MLYPSLVTSTSLRVMGHHCKERRSRMTVVSRQDMYRARHLVQAIGVNNIMGAGLAHKVRDLIRMFSAAGQEQQKGSP